MTTLLFQKAPRADSLSHTHLRGSGVIYTGLDFGSNYLLTCGRKPTFVAGGHCFFAIKSTRELLLWVKVGLKVCPGSAPPPAPLPLACEGEGGAHAFAGP